MSAIAISLGETICRVGFDLAGLGQSRCYDATSMQAFGYLVIFGFVLALVWTKLWSRA